MRRSLTVACAFLFLLLPAMAQAGHTVTLSCTPPVTSPDPVVGYHMLRSTTSGSGYLLINTGLLSTCAFVDTVTTPGATYYYVMRSVDVSGIESGNSNESVAVIPQKPSPPTNLSNVVN